MSSINQRPNRGLAAVALAGRIRLKGFDRPASEAPRAVPMAAASPRAVMPDAASTDRQAAIMALPEARSRHNQATHIAFRTNLSVGEARSMLAASPVDGRSGNGR
jgi:hypothetical protein